MELLLDKENLLTPTLNTSKWLKVLFLSFMQGAFYRYPTFQWLPDRRSTKIIIQDKFASSNINPERVPQIIFGRGPYRFSRITLDSAISSKTITKTEKELNSEYIRTASAFSCIAPDQATSEHIADLVWLFLLTFRSELRSKGIHFLNSAEVGESSPMSMSSTGGDIELFNTPVSFSYDFQMKYYLEFELEYDDDGNLVTPLFNSYDVIISGYPTDADIYPILSGVQ